MKTTVTWRNALGKLASTSALGAAMYLASVRTVSADGCPVPSFAAARAFDAATSPRSVAVGNFNGDGKPDLAVANWGGVSVLLGKGDGTFQAATTLLAGAASISVAAVGDFNGDGKLDLTVANEGYYVQSSRTFTNSSVSVLLGNGDGTFQTALNFDFGTGIAIHSMAVGDFNGDGKSNLVIANRGFYVPSTGTFTNGNISLMLGKGDGRFQSAVNYSAGVEPLSVAVGDFDGDGKSDVAVANLGSYDGSSRTFTDSSVWVLLGKGDGTFQVATNYPAGTAPISVAVGDFNRDGKLDLAVADDFNSLPGPSQNAISTVSVLLGNGDGTFQNALKYPAGSNPESVAVGDFNGDGKPDLVVANSSSGNVSVLLGKGDGAFQAAVNYDAGAEPFAVAVGDLNGDGKPDLAVADPGLGTVSVLLGKGDGTFQAVIKHSPGSGGPWAVGDFNGDGKLDFVLADVSVLLGHGDGTFETAIHSPKTVGLGTRSIAVGDLNGDGKLDVVMANSVNIDLGPFSVMLGNGDGTFQAEAIYWDTYGSSAALGDFNGDGKLDLALADCGSLSVLLGEGDGTFHDAIIVATGTIRCSMPAVGDFNNDGKLDLALANGGWYDPLVDRYTNSGVLVLLGKGDGTFRTGVNYRAELYPDSVSVDDFNGDGNGDLVVLDPYSTTNNISVLLGNGDGIFQAAVNDLPETNARSVAVGDFNGDGQPDLAVFRHGGVSVMLGKGDGTFQAVVKYAAGSFGTAGDFNGDGKPDLAVVGFDGISVLLNTCAAADNGVELSVGRSNATITVSWPFPSTGFVLESTTNLNLTNWQSAVEATVTNNGRLEVIVPTNLRERYFRLRKP